MKNRKVLKVIRITIVALVAAVLLVAATAFFVFKYAVKPRSEQIINAVDEIIKDEEIIKEIEPFLESEELEAIINKTEVLDQIDEEVAENTTKPAETPKEDVKKNETKTGNKNNTVKKPTSTPKPSSEPKKSREEYSSQTEYIKDNVSAADFSRGMSYASRVNVGYVMGLVSGGLTTEEKKELKAYLKARFSSSEIADGISLYSKYSHLLK